MNEQLNATEMRKIWGYEKCPDGTLMITAYKGSETMLQIPSQIGKNPVTAIGTNAFSPDRPGRRWSQRFALLNIRSVMIPEGITTIGDVAFSGCKRLTEIKLPESLITIDDRAFAYCESLTEITIPEGVTAMGAEVFCGCRELRRVTLPEYIESLTREVYFPGRAPRTYELFARCDKLEVLQAPGVWPEKVKNPVVRNALLMGFLAEKEKYKSPVKVRMYADQISGKRASKLLQTVFSMDAAQCIATYGAMGKITPENFEKEFLQPALAANATQCVAFLMEWKNKQTSVETDML